jgi:inhibitor of KinA
MLIEIGNDSDSATFERVYSLAAGISARAHPAILEVVPAYASLLVLFDPFRINRDELQEIIEGIEDAETRAVPQKRTRKLFTIPVLYGGDYGPDLDFIAHHLEMTCREIIRIHTSVPHMIYMLGFTPGFPYCKSTAAFKPVPRLEKPRVKVPAGSVGCAGSQTGIYPVESPGGWRLIGRTPVHIFRPSEENPFLFSPGDFIKFSPVDGTEYTQIKGLEEKGEYIPTVSSYEENFTGDALM